MMPWIGANKLVDKDKNLGVCREGAGRIRLRCARIRYFEQLNEDGLLAEQSRHREVGLGIQVEC
jgi:hypothetical protein